MAATVEFWFEFASTYSYPAAMRIEAACARHGVGLRWQPFLLGPIFARSGWRDSPFNLYAAKGRYMWRDMERLCAGLGLVFRRPSVFPRNGLLAARVACLGRDAPWLPAFVRAVYQANFAADADIALPSVLRAILDDLGLPAGDLLDRAAAPAAKAALRTQTEAADARGIFGAPMLLVGDEMFWGNDRLDQAIAWAADDGAAKPG